MRHRFTGEYAEDGKARRLAVREAADHRCIRCQHPFQSGKHGKGEWSPCDEKCTHGGPLGLKTENSIETLKGYSPDSIGGDMVKSVVGCTVVAQWRILTVHHFDGQKDNDAWWNTLALCQRCHLQIQTRVNPEIPWMFEHSDWLKPYVAGFYAKKYEGKDITREEAEARMPELLAYEQKA